MECYGKIVALDYFFSNKIIEIEYYKIDALKLSPYMSILFMIFTYSVYSNLSIISDNTL